MKCWKIRGILYFGIIGIFLNRCTPEEIILHGEISGIVTDALTNQPIQAATVNLIPSNVTINTGNDGKYLFKSLAPGNYQIQVSKQNYAEGNNSASVTSANTTDVDFALDAIPEIHYSTTVLDFGFSLTSLSFAISKTGPGEVAYISTPNKEWITVNPRSGDVDSETDSIKVTINRTGLTQKRIKEWIIIRTTYLQYDFLDTIIVNVWYHDPIAFNPGLVYGTVSDIEGNVYKTIQIGSQLWMAENLRTTTFSDNTAIPLVANSSIWGTLTTPACCWYDNDLYYKTDFGALYNWFAVSTGKLCPAGWHVPSVDELRTLGTYLGGNENAYVKLKEIGTSHWESPNEGATNESGFTALPSGGLIAEEGAYDELGKAFAIWSSEQYNASSAYLRQIVQMGGTNNYTNVKYSNKADGNSVRCIKDQP